MLENEFFGFNFSLSSEFCYQLEGNERENINPVPVTHRYSFLIKKLGVRTFQDVNLDGFWIGVRRTASILTRIS